MVLGGEMSFSSSYGQDLRRGVCRGLDGFVACRRDVIYSFEWLLKRPCFLSGANNRVSGDS